MTKEDKNNYDLCKQLLDAETEEQIIKILKKSNYWDDNSAWQLYGNIENNWSIIGVQQDSADKALVEKIVNSIDAVLLRECKVRNIDPEGEKAPKSINEALELFFGIKNGNLANLSATSRTNLAKNIGLIATGTRDKPNYIIFDLGEGQEPKDLPNTILSLSRSNKLRIPFVQGTFNMGGSGVLRFCGEHRFQLIISKKHPKISKNGLWGFTIVRREEPSYSSSMKSSVFRYLAPNNGILDFNLEEMEISSGTNDKQDIDPLKWGTIIKLYDYRMTGGLKTSIKLDLYYKLSLLLPRIGLPIRLYERRNYPGHTAEITLGGLHVRLSEDKSENLEENFPTSSEFMINGEKYKVEIYVFKKGGSSKYRKNEGIIYTYNGQAHGFEKISFYKGNDVKLDWLSDSLLTIVDCSEIQRKTYEDLFMNSRDRLTSGDLIDEVQEKIRSILKNHQGLKELNLKRRQETMVEKISDSKPFKDILNDVINKSPLLQALFISGEDIKNPFKFTSAIEEEKFIGKPHPTYFIIEKGNEFRECHLDQRFKVQFKTDVENEYFTRDFYPGEFSFKLNNSYVKDYSLNLWKGTATLNVTLPENVKEGNILNGEIWVNDETLIEPFYCSFKRKVERAINQNSGGKGERKNPSKYGNGDKQIPSRLALPDIHEVYHDEWDNYSFDKYSALTIRNNGDNSYSYLINIDNKYLTNEIKNNKNGEDKLLKEKFKISLVLLGMGILKDKEIIKKQIEEDGDNSELIYQIIEYVSRSFAPIVLPMIKSLSNLQI
ncbi:MAG: hypothetical protein GYA51_04675 [Candidatus Methanofastidiosa archaeon]|nr:hypothetical protein [Candidatus Methanofastidiosa archaeon]